MLRPVNWISSPGMDKGQTNGQLGQLWEFFCDTARISKECQNFSKKPKTRWEVLSFLRSWIILHRNLWTKFLLNLMVKMKAQSIHKAIAFKSLPGSFQTQNATKLPPYRIASAVLSFVILLTFNRKKLFNFTSNASQNIREGFESL